MFNVSVCAGWWMREFVFKCLNVNRALPRKWKGDSFIRNSASYSNSFTKIVPRVYAMFDTRKVQHRRILYVRNKSWCQKSFWCEQNISGMTLASHFLSQFEQEAKFSNTCLGKLGKWRDIQLSTNITMSVT